MDGLSLILHVTICALVLLIHHLHSTVLILPLLCVCVCVCVCVLVLVLYIMPNITAVKLTPNIAAGRVVVLVCWYEYLLAKKKVIRSWQLDEDVVASFYH